MIASRFPLRQMLLTSLCASALLMGACSGGDKAPAEEITVDAATLNLTSADEAALTRHFALKPRSATDSQTQTILDTMSFGEARYSDRTIEGASVIYTDWTASNEKGAIDADRVEFVGVHEIADGPTVDKLYVSGLRLKGYEGDGDSRETIMDASVGRLVVIEPSASMFDNLSDILMAQDASADSATDALSGDENFRALQVSDMTANVSEDDRSGTLSVKQVIVGNDQDAKEMDLVIETLTFDWSPEDGSGDRAFDLDMDGLTVMGLDLEQLDKPTVAGAGLMQGFIAGLAPSASSPYRQIDLGKMALVSPILDLKTDGFEADSDVKGSVTTVTSVLEPMVLTLKDLSGTPVAPYMDALQEHGFAEISLKGSSTAVFDRKADRVSFVDNRSEIDGGLRTRCDYSLLGLMAAKEAMDASNVQLPDLGEVDPETGQIDFEKYMAQSQRYQAARNEANSQIKIEGLTCDIQDVAANSFVDRAYNVASKVTGSPVAVLKGSAKTAIALGSLTAQSEFQRDLMDTVGSGLIDFIDTPGQTLTITMVPEQPVSMTSLTGQDGNEPSIKPLNLTVEVR